MWYHNNLSSSESHIPKSHSLKQLLHEITSTQVGFCSPDMAPERARSMHLKIGPPVNTAYHQDPLYIRDLTIKPKFINNQNKPYNWVDNKMLWTLFSNVFYNSTRSACDETRLITDNNDAATRDAWVFRHHHVPLEGTKGFPLRPIFIENLDKIKDIEQPERTRYLLLDEETLTNKTLKKRFEILKPDTEVTPFHLSGESYGSKRIEWYPKADNFIEISYENKITGTIINCAVCIRDLHQEFYSIYDLEFGQRKSGNASYLPAFEPKTSSDYLKKTINQDVFENPVEIFHSIDSNEQPIKTSFKPGFTTDIIRLLTGVDFKNMYFRPVNSKLWHWCLPKSTILGYEWHKHRDTGSHYKMIHFLELHKIFRRFEEKSIKEFISDINDTTKKKEESTCLVVKKSTQTRMRQNFLLHDGQTEMALNLNLSNYLYAFMVDMNVVHKSIVRNQGCHKWCCNPYHHTLKKNTKRKRKAMDVAFEGMNEEEAVVMLRARFGGREKK